MGPAVEDEHAMAGGREPLGADRAGVARAGDEKIMLHLSFLAEIMTR
jgi:hypothetical protein